MYNSEGCLATQKHINDRLDRHEKRLNAHGSRIDILEQNDKADAVRIESLCKQIASLVSIMKWFLGAIVGGIIAFFFAAIEKGLL